MPENMQDLDGDKLGTFYLLSFFDYNNQIIEMRSDHNSYSTKRRALYPRQV